MLDGLTVWALLGTVGVVVGVMLAGAGPSIGAFWQTPSVLLVLAGSALATLVSLPPRRLGSIAGVLRSAFRDTTPSPEAVIEQVVRMAEVARRQGMLALEEPARAVSDDFLRRALQMAIDGMDAATIESVMRGELEATDLRHTYGKNVLETMGRFAPVFGMIGTLIGLVLMLGQMSDPARIGPGMAVALLTTLYGLVIANVFCLPLARKLAGRSSDELMVKTMALRGVLAIHAGDHPRVVEQKLRAYLPAITRPSRDTGERSAVSEGERVGAGPGSQDAGAGLTEKPAATAQREAA
jgi:chemotaxis protein MotA